MHERAISIQDTCFCYIFAVFVLPFIIIIIINIFFGSKGMYGCYISDPYEIEYVTSSYTHADGNKMERCYWFFFFSSYMDSGEIPVFLVFLRGAKECAEDSGGSSLVLSSSLFLPRRWYVILRLFLEGREFLHGIGLDWVGLGRIGWESLFGIVLSCSLRGRRGIPV